jgi:outer membrane protein OmpA-like peptidoglycan-associated protein
MLLSNKIKTIIFTALCLAVCACSTKNSAENKKSVVQEERTYTPLHKQIITESKTLGSDAENIKYEDMVEDSDEGLVIIASAAVKPVEKEEIKNVVTEVVDIAVVEAPAAVESAISYQIATIHFDNGSSVVDSQYNPKIKEIAKLAKDKKAQINVYGFASSRTKNTDIMTHKMINFDVSLKRAENVAAALRKAGVPKNAITTEALSDTIPLYQEVMPEGERLNRRAEIYVSY